VAEAVKGIREDVVAQLVDQYVPGGAPEEQWDVPGLTQAIEQGFAVMLPIDVFVSMEEGGDGSGLRNKIVAALEEAYGQKETSVGIQVMRYIEKEVMLRTLDQHWREHLAAMDYMRQGIFLRSYAQKNPKQEYKREAFELFSAMLDRIKFDTLTTVSKIQVRSQAEIEREELERQQRLARALRAQHAEAVSPIQTLPAPSPGEPESIDPARSSSGNVMEIEPRSAPENAAPFVRPLPKVGRNEPCPCGSGRKYKHCHGTLQQASG
jgi:preprotein translocase subunit SecA